MARDDYGDLAITAVRDVLGDTVTYSPAGDDDVELAGIFEAADRFLSPELGGLDTGLPRLRVRTADLDDALVTPASGDSVTLEVRGDERTYRVLRVAQGDVGWTLLHLGDRT